MKTVPKESMRNALIMTAIAVIMTILVATVDVQPVGVEGTNLGFATINTGFFNRFGESHTFYVISKLAGLACFAIAGGFGLFFLVQLFQRKSLQKVDRNLTVMILLYLASMIVYLLFERFAINYRPVLRDEGLESSYPSTHTMLAYVIIVSAVDQWNIYIKNEKYLTIIVTASFLILAVVIVCRLLSGVHWLTDIIGGILIADMLIAWYRAAASR
ncbi:MAG: phosphatase PAP2 family protein [Lachnospiraceae bacterium]|nr:phosphatase PAP2 family protein [Lachnospiraceae bacterium]